MSQSGPLKILAEKLDRSAQNPKLEIRNPTPHGQKARRGGFENSRFVHSDLIRIPDFEFISCPPNARMRASALQDARRLSGLNAFENKAKLAPLERAFCFVL